jgi:hypothetical protein
MYSISEKVEGLLLWELRPLLLALSTVGNQWACREPDRVVPQHSLDVQNCCRGFAIVRVRRNLIGLFYNVVGTIY